MTRTDKFEFKTANGKEKPTIWFRLLNRDAIVNPFGLYDVLWDCSRKHYFSSGVYAEFHIYEDEIYGSFQDDSYGYYHFEYQSNIFLESAIQSLNALCHAVIKGEATGYDSFTEYTANKMQEGLKELNAPNDNIQILEEGKKLNIERFSFKFVEPYACDTHFVINIGNRSYESNLTDWSTNFNRIRLEMEKSILILYTDMEINLHYEDSPTIIRLNTSSLDRYRKISRITIIPNEFVNVPNVYGRCDTRQLFRSLYLGLLSLCIRETDWFDNDYVDWSDFRLATYNKLQSCAIENFIIGIKEDDCTYMPRQRIINTVEEMMEDYQLLQNKL